MSFVHPFVEAQALMYLSTSLLLKETCIPKISSIEKEVYSSLPPFPFLLDFSFEEISCVPPSLLSYDWFSSWVAMSNAEEYADRERRSAIIKVLNSEVDIKIELEVMKIF
jgi:hypothetical protein